MFSRSEEKEERLSLGRYVHVEEMDRDLGGGGEDGEVLLEGVGVEDVGPVVPGRLDDELVRRGRGLAEGVGRVLELPLQPSAFCSTERTSTT